MPAHRPLVAVRLAMIWAAAALVLAGWLALAQPAVPARTLATGPVLDLAPPPPGGDLISTWVFWEARDGAPGWVILEGAEPWTPDREPVYRRRVHPGWNRLRWADFPRPALAAGARLRVLAGNPAAWGATPIESAPRHGIRDLAPLAGLLLAGAVALGVGGVRLVRWAAAAPRPDGWVLGVAGLTAVGAALRLHTLTAQSLWLDEVLTAIGSQDFAWVLYTPQIFGHPPLQYLAGWLVGGGVDEAALRGPFLAAGVATIPAIAWLGRALDGPATGLAAAAALALAPFHVDLSQTARPYAPLLLLSTLALLALVRAVRDGRAGDWLLFSAAAALVVYTQYAGAVVVLAAAATAAVLLTGRPRAAWASALVSFGAVVLLLVPWLGVTRRLATAQLGGGHLPAGELWALLRDVFLPQYLGGPTGRTVGLALIACAFWSLRRRPRLGAVLGLWLALPVGVLWAAQPAHFVAGRHLAFLLVPLVLLLGLGVRAVAARAGAAVARAMAVRVHLVKRLAAAALAAAVLGAWAVPAADALRAHYASRRGFDWRVVAALLEATVPPGEPVLATNGAAYPLRHYWRWQVEVLEPDTYEAQLAARRKAGAVWVVTHEGWDRPPGVAAWLEAHAVCVGEVPPSWSLPGVRIWRVVPASRAASRPLSLPQLFATMRELRRASAAAPEPAPSA